MVEGLGFRAMLVWIARFCSLQFAICVVCISRLIAFCVSAFCVLMRFAFLHFAWKLFLRQNSVCAGRCESYRTLHIQQLRHLTWTKVACVLTLHFETAACILCVLRFMHFAFRILHFLRLRFAFCAFCVLAAFCVLPSYLYSVLRLRFAFCILSKVP